MIVTIDIPDELYTEYLKCMIDKYNLQARGLNKVNGIREINSKYFIEKIQEVIK